KIDVVNSADDKIISDADLDVLLDRSPEVFKERGIGWGKEKVDGDVDMDGRGKKKTEGVAFKESKRQSVLQVTPSVAGLEFTYVRLKQSLHQDYSSYGSIERGRQDLMSEKRTSICLPDSKNDELEATAFEFSAAGKALSIPELLSTVFSFCEKAKLATYAGVCKIWSEIALDDLWKDLATARPLFNLVLPKVLQAERGDLGEETSNLFSTEDWARFHYYSKRVRSVKVVDNDPKWIRVLDAFDKHHPYNTSPLPGLRAIQWIAQNNGVPLTPFISERLQDLVMSVESLPTDQMVDLVNSLRDRVPNLRHLSIRSIKDSAEIQLALVECLGKLDKLERIHLSPVLLKAKILSTLGQLPKLRLANLKVYDNPRDESYELDTLPELLPESFPSLRTLQFTVAPPIAQQLIIEFPQSFSKLSYLCIEVLTKPNSDQIYSLTQHLAPRCPKLTTLQLYFYPSSNASLIDALPLSKEAFKNLYQCRWLKHLRITHILPIDFDSADVEDMGRAWPQMIDLSLGSAPWLQGPALRGVDGMGFGFSILSAFAQHLPNIQRIALYFHKHRIMTFDGNLRPKYRFTRLPELSVGGSPRPKSHSLDLGFYLASLGIGRLSFKHDEEWDRFHHIQRKLVWEEVANMLAFAARIKCSA
ncbi:hypothetical protein FRB90_008323, partial [Tulasnella sp. 427]